MVPQFAKSHDVGSSLVDAVYSRHGTYEDHLRRQVCRTAVADRVARVRAALTPRGGYRANVREAGKIAAYLGQRFVSPAFTRLREDAVSAALLGLWVVGWGCGVAALALPVLP